jgi:site-specific recombinase XerD
MQDYSQYLQIKGYQKTTIKKHLLQINAFVKTNKNPIDYYQELKNKHLKNSTLNLFLYALSIYNDYLTITEKPSFTIPIIREKIQLEGVDYLTLAEVQMLFKSTNSPSGLTLRDQAILVCLYHLGLRNTEASHLLVSEVDVENNLVLVSQSKNGCQRQVPLSQKAKVIIERYLQVRNHLYGGQTPYFLIGSKGQLSTSSILRIVKKLQHKSGIPKRIYPHLLRHSIATHLLQNGMPLEKVSQFLGHKNMGATQRYTHL